MVLVVWLKAVWLPVRDDVFLASENLSIVSEGIFGGGDLNDLAGLNLI